MRSDEVLPGCCVLAALGCWRQAMTPKNIAYCLIRNSVTEVGQSSDNPIVSPAWVLSCHPDHMFHDLATKRRPTWIQSLSGTIELPGVPDAAHEALRDLVRAREAAKKDQLRARHRLGKFLLRHGQRPTKAGKAWTKKCLEWIKTHVRFDQPALEATLAHYLHEVDHAAEQILKLEKAIDEAVAQSSPEIRSVIEALQALRGVAQMTAATLVCELGSLSLFQSPRQLMGYSGLVSREHSSGNHIQRGAITKTGNAHLRRVLVEAAWAYQHRPNVTGFLLRRQNR
jgi:transposase